MRYILLAVLALLLESSCDSGGGTTGGSGLTDEQKESCDIGMMTLDPSDTRTQEYNCYEFQGISTEGPPRKL